MSTRVANEPGFYAGQFRKAGQSYPAPDLSTMSKDELVAEAALRGVEIKPDDSEAKIRAALKAAG